MSSVAELLKQMRAKHDAMNDRIADAPDSQMDAAGDWGDRKMPIRLMTFQLLGHEVEHTIQAVKTLRDLGIVQTEAQLIMGRLQQARGQLEGLLIGLSDEDLDRAPEGEWSMRQVLEHFMQTEDFYLDRIEQAMASSG